MKKQVLIRKASGDMVPFSRTKLLQSLRRSGASQSQAQSIADAIVAEVKSGMSTRDIYTRAFDRLKRQERSVAARYSLKEAIMQFGPTGYPFEAFIGELFRAKGYAVSIGTTVRGWCIPHEIDVIAEKEQRHIMVEAKFHNGRGYHTDVKVPLYIHSRYLDVVRQLQEKKHASFTYEQWIITNTRFTKDAVAYGTCMGMHLLGWRYPKEGGLERLIEESGLHPITCLTTLTSAQKNQLLTKGIVLCKDLTAKESSKMLASLGLSAKKISQIQQEVHGICHAQRASIGKK